jgi:uncharacterized protein YnzC (UPF0291/DUF896 family)
MSKKVTNNLVADIKRDHVLTDRTVYSQLSYRFENIIQSIRWNIKNKQEKIEAIDQIVQDGHTFNQETGSQIEPDWVQLSNNRQWQVDQQDVEQTLLEYFIKAQKELFVDDVHKAKSQADAFESLKRIAS